MLTTSNGSFLDGTLFIAISEELQKEQPNNTRYFQSAYDSGVDKTYIQFFDEVSKYTLRKEKVIKNNKDYLEFIKETHKEFKSHLNRSIMKPTQNYVVLEIPKFEEKTKSGIIKGKDTLEDEMKMLNKFKLNVLATGPDCKTVKVGDLVVMERHAAPTCTDVEFNGTVATMLRETSIIAIY